MSQTPYIAQILPNTSLNLCKNHPAYSQINTACDKSIVQMPKNSVQNH